MLLLLACAFKPTEAPVEPAAIAVVEPHGPDEVCTSISHLDSEIIMRARGIDPATGERVPNDSQENRAAAVRGQTAYSEE